MDNIAQLHVKKSKNSISIYYAMHAAAKKNHKEKK